MNEQRNAQIMFSLTKKGIEIEKEINKKPSVYKNENNILYIKQNVVYHAMCLESGNNVNDFLNYYEKLILKQPRCGMGVSLIKYVATIDDYDKRIQYELLRRMLQIYLKPVGKMRYSLKKLKELVKAAKEIEILQDVMLETPEIQAVFKEFGYTITSIEDSNQKIRK